MQRSGPKFILLTIAWWTMRGVFGNTSNLRYFAIDTNFLWENILPTCGRDSSYFPGYIIIVIIEMNSCYVLKLLHTQSRWWYICRFLKGIKLGYKEHELQKFLKSDSESIFYNYSVRNANKNPHPCFCPVDHLNKIPPLFYFLLLFIPFIFFQ